MTKKTLMIITGVLGGAATIAGALITGFVASPLSSLINTAVGIAVTAVIDICTLFVIDDSEAKKLK